MQTAEFKNSVDKSETDIKTIVAKIVENSSSYEEAYEVLLEAYEDDDLEAFEEELSSLITNSTLAGL